MANYAGQQLTEDYSEQSIGTANITKETIISRIDQLTKQSIDLNNYINDVLGQRLLPVRSLSPANPNKEEDKLPTQNVMGMLMNLSLVIKKSRDDLGHLVAELDL